MCQSFFCYEECADPSFGMKKDGCANPSFGRKMDECANPSIPPGHNSSCEPVMSELKT